MKELITNTLRGTVLGIAMIIPGVSGGTMALVMGIYERLIMTVNTLTPSALKEFLPPYPNGVIAKWKTAAKAIDLLFLMALGGGAVVIIGALSRVMPYLMEHHHEPTYGFFLGLILASVIVPLKMIKKITPLVIVMAVVGTAAAGLLGHADNHRRHRQIEETHASAKRPDAEKPATAPSKVKPARMAFIGLAMAIAMSACILPGVSGSLIMVIFGTYTDVLGAVSAILEAVLNARVPPMDSILVLCCAMVGALIGLIAFAKIMKFLLNRLHDVTMGGLVGLMLGSLYVIWPFRESGIISSRSKEKLVFGYPEMPVINTTFWLTIVMAAVGIGIIVAMDVIDRKRKKTATTD